MYQINPLQQNVLITNAEVIFHAPTKHTLDPRSIQNAIIIAEERFIRPELGDDLYTALINQKNVVVSSSNLAALQTSFNTSNPGVSYTLKEGDIINALEFLSPANLRLWKQGNLWKAVAEAVMVMAIPDEFVQFRSEGIVHPQPTGSVMSSGGVVTPDLASVKWVMDKKQKDRIDPLVASIKTFICKYKSDYPLYTSCPCDDPCFPDKNAPVKGSTWITSVYDEPNNDCCV